MQQFVSERIIPKDFLSYGIEKPGIMQYLEIAVKNETYDGKDSFKFLITFFIKSRRGAPSSRRYSCLSGRINFR